MNHSNLIFAYFSPETLLPVGSIIATVLGVMMMLGRGSVRFLIRSAKRVLPTSAWIAGVSRPHFRVRELAERETVQAESSDQAQAIETNYPN